MKTQYIKMCETVKTVKRGKFLSLNAYIGKEETSQINNVTLPHPRPTGASGFTRMAQMGVGTQGRKPVGAPPSSFGKHREQTTFILSWSQTAALSAVTQR